MKGGRLQFVHDETKSLAALARIAKDMAERDLVLGDIRDIDGKHSYLDQLEREGLLPRKVGLLATAERTKPADKLVAVSRAQRRRRACARR